MIYILTPDKKVCAVLDNDSGQSCPFYNDVHVEQLQEFNSTYSFTSPAGYEQSQYLVIGNYVALIDLDNQIQLFRITNIVDGFDSNGKNIQVQSENAAIFDLNGVIVRPFDFTGMSAKDCLEKLLEGSEWTVGTCDITDTPVFKPENYQTAQADLHTLANVLTADVKFHIEMQGTVITNQYVDLIQHRGMDNGKRFEYTKDLQSVTRTTNITNNFATAIIPQGATPEGQNTPINITSVNGGKDYIANDEANQIFNPNSTGYIYKVYKNDQKTTPADLLADAEKQLAIVSTPEITYDCSVILLQRLAGYNHEKVSLGDTVSVVDKSLQPALTVKARVIELDVSYSDHTQDKAVLGDYVPIQDVTPMIVQQINSQVKNVVSGLDFSQFKVDISTSNGTTFKNGQGTTDLIARVYNGKTNITSQLNNSDFIWYKVNIDGMHDLTWEANHAYSGNMVTVNSSDVIGSATFYCEINQGQSGSILVANEANFDLQAILTNEVTDSQIGGIKAQSVYVDDQNSCIYWAFNYTGTKVGSYNLAPSYGLVRTNMEGTTVFDQMWVIGGGNSTLGFEIGVDSATVYSNFMNSSTRNYTLVSFPYTAGKTLTWGDSSIHNLNLTQNSSTGISIDAANNMACLSLDNHMGNVDLYIIKLSDLKSGKLTSLYVLKASDYGFDNANQKWKNQALYFPYLYQNSGVADTTQSKSLYCIDVRTKELVYKMDFQFNTQAVTGDPFDSEPEGLCVYNNNGKRTIAYCLAVGTGGSSTKSSKLYSLIEDERSLL